jgi:hypothetical protein
VLDFSRWLRWVQLPAANNRPQGDWQPSKEYNPRRDEFCGIRKSFEAGCGIRISVGANFAS